MRFHFPDQGNGSMVIIEEEEEEEEGSILFLTLAKLHMEKLHLRDTIAKCWDI